MNETQPETDAGKPSRTVLLVWALLASAAVMCNLAIVSYFCFPPAPWLVHTVNWIIWSERQREWTILACFLILMLPLCLDALWRVDREKELTGAFPAIPVHGAP